MIASAEIGRVLEHVLHGGDIDTRSQKWLGLLYRAVQADLAAHAPQPISSNPSKMSERDYCDSFSDHVGSISFMYSFTPDGNNGSLFGALYDARLPWLDELDQMSDAELLAVRGIGRVRLAELRSILDLYYWRGNHDDSRRGWKDVAARLLSTLDYPYLGDRRPRVHAGLEFAHLMLDIDRKAERVDRWEARLRVP